ncbi:wall surface anchor family domain protein, partial [Chlamydia psittaci 08-2626_L3]
LLSTEHRNLQFKHWRLLIFLSPP